MPSQIRRFGFWFVTFFLLLMTALAIGLNAPAIAQTDTSFDRPGISAADVDLVRPDSGPAGGDREPGWRREQCRYARADGRHGFTDDEVAQTIRCAFARWSVDGGVSKALSVARCESGLNEFARNSSSSAAGVFQFVSGTWDSQRGHYARLGSRWHLPWSVFSARANVVVAARYAHEGGWSPWGCA